MFSYPPSSIHFFSNAQATYSLFDKNMCLGTRAEFLETIFVNDFPSTNHNLRQSSFRCHATDVSIFYFTSDFLKNSNQFSGASKLVSNP